MFSEFCEKIEKIVTGDCEAFQILTTLKEIYKLLALNPNRVDGETIIFNYSIIAIHSKIYTLSQQLANLITGDIDASLIYQQLNEQRFHRFWSSDNQCESFYNCQNYHEIPFIIELHNLLKQHKSIVEDSAYYYSFLAKILILTEKYSNTALTFSDNLDSNNSFIFYNLTKILYSEKKNITSYMLNKPDGYEQYFNQLISLCNIYTESKLFIVFDKPIAIITILDIINNNKEHEQFLKQSKTLDLIFSHLSHTDSLVKALKQVSRLNLLTQANFEKIISYNPLWPLAETLKGYSSPIEQEEFSKILEKTFKPLSLVNSCINFFVKTNIDQDFEKLPHELQSKISAIRFSLE